MTAPLSIQNRNESYFNLSSKQGQIQRLIDTYKSYPNGLTDAEVARKLNMPKSTVSARRNDIKESMIEVGSKVDEFSGKSVTVWKYVEQTTLFKVKKVTPSKKLKLVKELCMQYPCPLAELINQLK